MELKDTVNLMCSDDYKERFKAEYYQTKVRYEKLKSFNNRIMAADMVRMPMPEHTCPEHLLRDQQRIMGEYLGLLELRAVIENIEL